MKNDGDQPKPKPSTSVPPPRPPRVAVVGADAGDGDSGRMTKPDYGCWEELWELYDRYFESDIHGAHSALVEQEQLLRDHIHFPGYKRKLAMTTVRRSDIVRHLGDAQKASSILAEAFQIAPEFAGKSEFLLKAIREQDARFNVKWRQVDYAA
jgi:hypothetical protein